MFFMFLSKRIFVYLILMPYVRLIQGFEYNRIRTEIANELHHQSLYKLRDILVMYSIDSIFSSLPQFCSSI